jgi:hypothetical protein
MDEKHIEAILNDINEMLDIVIKGQRDLSIDIKQLRGEMSQRYDQYRCQTNTYAIKTENVSP